MRERLVDGDPQIGDVLQELAVRFGKAGVGDLALAVGDEAEPAPGGDAGVELLERAGGCVAGVGKGLFARSLQFRVELLKIVRGDASLAAQFEQRMDKLVRMLESLLETNRELIAMWNARNGVKP